MDDLDAAVRDLAETLNTGSPPGKPPTPFVPRFLTGTITAVSAPKCTVQFDPTTTIAGLSYLLTGRTLVIGDIVLVMQTPHQRLVIAAISH